MFKRLSLVCLCLLVGVFLASPVFSQEAPIEDNQVTEETVDTPAESPEAIEPVAADEAATSVPAQKAKTFNDGVNTYVNPLVQFKLFSDDNFMADKIMYRVDNGAEREYTDVFSISDEGSHKIVYYGIDKIGNRENEKTFNVIVDNTAPVVRVLSAAPIIQRDGMYYVSQANIFTVNAMDELSGLQSVRYIEKGSDYVEYTTSFSFYSVGELDFRLIAEDNVANQSSSFQIAVMNQDGTEQVVTRDSLKLYVDNLAPEVSIASDKEFIMKGSRKVASREFKYSIAATDKDSGVKKILYRLDGKGSFVPYEKEIMFSSNGEHFIEAKAVDAVGNESRTVVLSVYVDLIPPMSNIQISLEAQQASPSEAPAVEGERASEAVEGETPAEEGAEEGSEEIETLPQ